jgi:hypothetical protein
MPLEASSISSAAPLLGWGRRAGLWQLHANVQARPPVRACGQCGRRAASQAHMRISGSARISLADWAARNSAPAASLTRSRRPRRLDDRSGSSAAAPPEASAGAAGAATTAAAASPPSRPGACCDMQAGCGAHPNGCGAPAARGAHRRGPRRARGRPRRVLGPREARPGCASPEPPCTDRGRARPLYSADPVGRCQNHRSLIDIHRPDVRFYDPRSRRRALYFTNPGVTGIL